MQLGVLGHLLDLFLGEAGRALDGDLLVLAGAEVLGGDVEDAVGVDVEGDLDLRGAARRGRNAVELERAEGLVVARHGALALQHDDLHGGLVVAVGREDLGLLRGNGGVARDHRRRDVAGGHDAQRERGDVEEEHVAHVALEHAALHGRADSDHLVRVHALMRGLAAEALRELDDLGHAGHAADEHEFVNLGRGEFGVLEAVLERGDGALEEAVADLLHLGAAELHVEVLRTRGVGRDEGQVDVHRLGGRERDLGFLGLFLEALEGHRVFAEVDAVFLLEGVHEPADEGVVPVVAAEVGVAVGGLHLEDAVADLKDRDVEGAAAEVEHGDLLVLLLVEAVGERSGGGLVDDAEDLKAGDLAGVLGGLALRVVEIGRHGDHGLRDLLAEVGLGVGLQLAEDEGGNLLRGELLGLVAILHLDVGVAVFAFDDLEGHVGGLSLDLGELATDEALRRENGVARVRHRLALRRLADEPLAGLGEGHDGRRGAGAFGIGNDHRLAAFHDGHAGVRGAEIDA